VAEKCPSCGVEVDAQAVFCHKCGARLDDQEQEMETLESAGGFPANRSEPASQEEAPAEAAHPSNAERLYGKSASSGRDDDDDREEELWSGGYSPKAMYPHWIIASVLTIAAMVIVSIYSNSSAVWIGLVIGVLVLWGVLFLMLLWRRLGVSYRLTSHRFFHEKGVFSRHTDRIECIDIDDVTYRQGLLERMYDVGTIHIRSGDVSHPELDIKGIENVRSVASLIDDARRKERVRRGVHVVSGGSRT